MVYTPEHRKYATTTNDHELLELSASQSMAALSDLLRDIQTCPFQYGSVLQVPC